MERDPGILTISLDFELFWGTRDSQRLEDYGPNILGVRAAIPKLLDLFEEFDIHATWAVVGFLFFRDGKELAANVPRTVPRYLRAELNPYDEIPRLVSGERDERYFFARELVDRIAGASGQELASHTFSHYYCLEPGQELDAFVADLDAVREAAKKEAHAEIVSLVFPRNQFNVEYLGACKAAGVEAYRGNPRSWVYEPRSEREESLVRRGVRLMDSYVNLTGHHGHELSGLRKTLPVDVPASRFLRPWSRRLRALEPIRLARICGDLTFAAKQARLYHLWWHPENFGRNLEENLTFLRRVLVHFSSLRERFGMRTLGMAEVSRLLDTASRESLPAA